MCLAIPAKVVSVENDNAVVSMDGIQKQVSLALVDNVVVGDYVLLHVGYALNKIDPDEAQKTLALFAEAGMLSQGL